MKFPPLTQDAHMEEEEGPEKNVTKISESGEQNVMGLMEKPEEPANQDTDTKETDRPKESAKSQEMNPGGDGEEQTDTRSPLHSPGDTAERSPASQPPSTEPAAAPTLNTAPAPDPSEAQHQRKNSEETTRSDGEHQQLFRNSDHGGHSPEEQTNQDTDTKETDTPKQDITKSQEMDSACDGKEQIDTSSLLSSPALANENLDEAQSQCTEETVHQPDSYQKCNLWLKGIPSDLESVPASVKTSHSKDQPLNISTDRTQTSRPAYKPNMPCRANKADRSSIEWKYELDRGYESENLRRYYRNTDDDRFPVEERGENPKSTSIPRQEFQSKDVEADIFNISTNRRYESESFTGTSIRNINDDSGVGTEFEIDHFTSISNTPESPFRSSVEKTGDNPKSTSTPWQEFQSKDVEKKSSIIFLVALLPVAVLMLVTGLYGYSKEHKVGHHELRLMLVGKTGAGKSASGNTILGEEAFRVEASPASVTAHCEKKNKAVDGRNITVIDTPGVMDTWLTSKQTAHSAPVCIHHPAHRPHVFLLLVRLGRFTEEERNAVNWIQENFGEEAVKFTMILFTGGDLLGRKPIEKFISNSVELQNLVDTCEGRYHVFNNNQKNNHAQVTELLEKIDLLLFRSLGYTHTQEVHQRVQHNTREEEEKKKLILIKEIKSEESQKRDAMERTIREEEELKRKQMERKMKEEKTKDIETREEEIRQEEELKRSKMKEGMKAEKQRKMNEMTVKLRDEQYENQKLQAELEKAYNTNFWLWVVITCTSPLYLITCLCKK